MKNIPRFVPSLTIKEIVDSLFYKNKDNKEYPLDLFAKEFARYIGVTYAIPAPSGRIALAAILHALALPKGGEVLMPSLLFHCMPRYFQAFGLVPRFIDIDPTTCCIDCDSIEAAITELTVALFPVHLYGRSCHMARIKEIAAYHKLVIIEDCAQSCGGFFMNKKLGSFGDAAIFSFHPHKNISILGMGMVVTNSLDVAEKCTIYLSRFSNNNVMSITNRVLYAAFISIITRPFVWSYGILPILLFFNMFGLDLVDYLTNEEPAKNARNIDNVQAFLPTKLYGYLGMSQLEKLDMANKKRMMYGAMLSDILKNIPQVEVLSATKNEYNIFTTFVIKVKNPKKFRICLQRYGVDSHGGNMSVGPQLPGLNDFGESKKAVETKKHMVHLPLYADMTESDVRYIAFAIRKTISKISGDR